jgi:hypothetical protein
MQNLLKYLKFLAASSNHHGVHSPFVYRYVTECLYKKPRLHRNHMWNVLLKSIGYFSAAHLLILGAQDALASQIRSRFPDLHFGAPPYDLIIAQKGKIGDLWPLLEAGDKLHNDTLILIDAPHEEPSWEQLKAHPMVRVTVDLFYCGVVFLRKEQAKEHFKIRI